MTINSNLPFHLRPFTPDDAESFFRYSNNPQMLANMADGFPTSLKSVQNTLAHLISLDGSTALIRAIEIHGEAAGSIGVFAQPEPDSKSAELAYWLAEPYWGQGIMPAAIRQICQAAFDTFDITRIFARPYARNTSSRRALEKAGFMLETILSSNVMKNGELIDSAVYALYRQ